MLETGVTQTHRLAWIREHNARRAVQKPREEQRPAPPPGRVPRITKLMALAIRFENLLATGAVRDQTELAELGHVTRARVTQIMNLLHLAPTIQEEILFLPRVMSGKDPIAERNLRPIVRRSSWATQRRLWRDLASEAANTDASAVA